MSKNLASDSNRLKWGAKKLSLMVSAGSCLSPCVSAILELYRKFIRTFRPPFLLLLLRSSRCNNYSPCYECNVLQAFYKQWLPLGIILIIALLVLLSRFFSFWPFKLHLWERSLKVAELGLWERSLAVAALADASFSRHIDTYELLCYEVWRIGTLALQNTNAQCSSRQKAMCTSDVTLHSRHDLVISSTAFRPTRRPIIRMYPYLDLLKGNHPDFLILNSTLLIVEIRHDTLALVYTYQLVLANCLYRVLTTLNNDSS